MKFFKTLALSAALVQTVFASPAIVTADFEIAGQKPVNDRHVNLKISIQREDRNVKTSMDILSLTLKTECEKDSFSQKGKGETQKVIFPSFGAVSLKEVMYNVPLCDGQSTAMQLIVNQPLLGRELSTDKMIYDKIHGRFGKYSDKERVVLKNFQNLHQ